VPVVVRSRLLVYDKDHLEEAEDLPLEVALPRLKAAGTGWLTLYAPTDADYALLERDLDLHPLALEDSRNQRQRPKVEAYSTHTYLVARSSLRGDDGELRSTQSNIFFSHGASGWVLVIHDRPLGLFDDVRDRLRRGRTRIRAAGADYLVYALVDSIVDTMFPHLERIGDTIEAIEEELDDGPNGDALTRIHALRRDLRRMRRVAWPTREMVAALLREESFGMKKQTTPFLRDVHDHSVQAMDLIDNHREAATSLADLHLTLVSQRTNETMKVLTIVATIFIPLTFIAGVYGMNFDPDTSPWNMPELHWYYGYPLALLFMLVVIAIELWYFRRKGWI
jgi:magnesium transporter